MRRAPFTVHVAAAPTGPVQCCVACGFVLQDNSPWFEGRVEVAAGDDRGMSWWPAGTRVATDKTEGSRGGTTYALGEGRALDVDEQLCAGAC